MLKLILILIFINLMNFTASAQINDENFRVYDAKGNAASLQQIIETIGKSDVVFLGENHDDATAHFLQAEIFKKAFENYAKNRKVTLSMEMFERDVQTVVDEYLKDLITEKKFLDDSRPWNNYQTDYRPLMEFAKQNSLPVIAANAPRRYVNMVSRNGRDSLNQLSTDAKSWLAPLPYAAPSAEYAKKFNALMGNLKSETNAPSKILEAQALWDATMAFSISERLKKEKNALVVHLNGSFHTENRLGTAEQFLKLNPNAKITVVTMRSEDDFTKFDRAKHENLGDFLILTDAKVPRSFK
ncbi:MAG: ChaN family lipoprotein [Pyrinomonadaceae bacterium]|nr:ChaN family lipoprotein [Pyrinomonadaceae bacterium]